jgi:hypothetical protein
MRKAKEHKEKEMRRAWAELVYPNKFIPSPC